MFWLLLPILVASVTASPVLYRRQSAYPASDLTGPPPKAEWIASYDAARNAGKIPEIPHSRLVNGNIVYPAEVHAETVCSWTVTGCFGPRDIFNAPDGLYGISFDDGPLKDSPALYRFLQDQNQTATHFFIGGNVVDNAPIFAQALASGGHIGSHSWSHPYMSTLTDHQILGELGWTSQAIYDLSGGFVPKYWRPPSGDADNRVRAIAEDVFGLTLVGWNQDSDDWCLNDSGGSVCRAEGPSNLAALEREILQWINQTSKPGIIGLQHELSSSAIEAFINTFPKLEESSWDARCIPDLLGDAWYQNAPRNTSPIPNLATVGGGPASSLAPISHSTISPTGLPSPAQESQAPISVSSHQISTASCLTVTSFTWAVPLSLLLSFAACFGVPPFTSSFAALAAQSLRAHLYSPYM